MPLWCVSVPDVYNFSVLEFSLAQVILPVIIGLELSVAGVRVTLHAMGVFGLFVRDENFGDIATLGSGLGKQLAVTGMFERQEQEGSFVDRLANSQETVVLQNAGLVGGAQCLCDLLSFFPGEDGAAERVVD